MAALPPEEKPWRPKGYPETDCPHHPGVCWEWDVGIGWICSGCVIGMDDIPVNRTKK